MIGDLTHHLVHLLDSPSVAPCSNLRCCCWTPKSVCGCCLFLFLGGRHIFAFRTKKSENEQAIKAAKSGRRNFILFFQKLKLKIKDEKDRTKTDRYMKATPKNRVRVIIAVSCLIDRTFSAVGNTAFLFQPAKGGKKKKKNKEKEKE